MAIIKVEFDLKIPTGWLTDPEASVENFTETLTSVYQGDDKCYVAIDENGDAPYGFGAVSEKEMNDGPPEQGEGYDWLEIDCTENPIFCSLHGDLDPALALEDGGMPAAKEVIIPVTEGHAGFPPVKYNSLFEASDFYRTSQINIINKEPFLIPYTTMTNMFGSVAEDTTVTWQDVRDRRDQELLGSDSWLASDMPDNISKEITDYRNLLRNMTEILADVPPHLVMQMFPLQPAFMQPAE
jgi:hypothetical protein